MTCNVIVARFDWAAVFCSALTHMERPLLLCCSKFDGKRPVFCIGVVHDRASTQSSHPKSSKMIEHISQPQAKGSSV